jgi:nucleotide-binding universal stress UspA family protein
MTESKDQPSMAHSKPSEALMPLQIRQILAPTDLTPHSDDALRYAIRLAVAAEISADLLVIATHGRAGLAHLFHPNPADRILHEAPCPVLVVRSPHAPAPTKPAWSHPGERTIAPA